MDARCRDCGSTRVMPAQLVERFGGAAEVASVQVLGAPAALLFKDPAKVPLVALVCAECGRVELRVSVEDARLLQEKHRKASFLG